ncbi:MAG TPA: Dabb family protein [Candidatus Parabacteroides intestinipullorum]|uniref:Dabb family protein n=1 Tax=Candidatus Parabacteroides intestinipullorum TaxID=2838723 RepID=A0A9D1X8S2_9BACT|nr:Dabb family protein [Candidatus Parabacteroides intestinipullorum]
MIRHIVMFKLKEFENAEAKQAKLNEIKERLEALIDKIEVLKYIHVDFNCNPAETWDLILTTELATLEDVNTYANHPEHVAVAKGIIGPVKADRACVDYEVR